MHLRQLPANTRPPVSSGHSPQLSQSPQQPMRRLIQHHHTLLFGQLLQTSLPALLRRQKALETPTLTRQTAPHQRRNHGRRTGQTLHLHTGLQCSPHQQETRITHARRARIGHQGHLLATLQSLHKPRHATVLIILVIRLHPRPNVIVLQQHTSPASILTKHRPYLTQHPQTAKRHILQIANRRRNQMKHNTANINPLAQLASRE